MKNYQTLAALVGLPAVVMLAACTKPTLTERNFGASVRQMIEAQTYDQSTLTTPPTEPIESADGQRLENVLETYRIDVAKPAAASEDIGAVIGGQR